MHGSGHAGRPAQTRAWPRFAPVACAILAWLAAAAGLPASAQDPVGDTLWSQGTLYRDEWGVPHVFAETPESLGFVFGYAQSEDHLLDMLKAYRIANGTAAAVWGEPYADSDAFAVKMNHARLALEAFPYLDPLTRALCSGFAHGVNRYIIEHAARLPEWVEGVHPQDILALWHAFILSTAPYDLPPPFTRPPAADTGNAWALAPARMEDGRALLVINPHQYHDGPFKWYEAHLRLGPMNMAGATLFGLPVIVQGHNEVLGWALTPNAPDFADLFQEQFEQAPRNPRDPRTASIDVEQALVLMYMAEAKPYYVRTPRGLDERLVPAYVSARGPVFEHGPALYSWRIGGYGQFGGLRQLMEMGSARNLGEFQQALAAHQLPCFNILYADQQGNLFYLYNARTGTRDLQLHSQEDARQAGALDWKSPVPFELDATAWFNTVPVDQLPHVINPPSGYLQACNTAPWFATDGTSLTPGQYPPWFVGEQDNYRAQRVRQLLQHGSRSFRDAHSMLYDVVLPGAAEFAPRLVSLGQEQRAQAEAAHPDLMSGLMLLRDWNFAASANSAAATYYHAWWQAAQQRAAAQVSSPEALYQALRQGTAPAQRLMLDAAADAARMMRNEFRDIHVPWGEVQRLDRGARDAPLFGGATGDSIFLTRQGPIQNGRARVNYGYGFAMAVQFGETPVAHSIVPFGASEMPESVHFDDQMALFLEKRLKKTRFVETEVLRNAASARGVLLRFRPLGVDGEVRMSAQQVIQGRVRTTVEGPGILPPGLAPFSLFMAPEHAPLAVRVALDAHVTVPEALCARDALHELGLYAFDDRRGWQRLANQQLDVAKRRFQAEAAGGSILAVLGPETLLQQPASGAPRPPLQAASDAPPMPVIPGAPVSVAPDPEAPAPPETIAALPPPAAPGEALTETDARGNRGVFMPAPGQSAADAGGRKLRLERLDPDAPPAEAKSSPDVDYSDPATGRKFRFQWLGKMRESLTGKDKEKQAGQQDSFKPAGPTGGRTFRFQRLDRPEDPAPEAQEDTPEEETETSDGSDGSDGSALPAADDTPAPLPEASEDDSTGGAPTGRRIFNFQRLDR